jgi:flavin reductase
MVEAQTFRNAMGLLGAAVNIITTDGPHGRHGFTASAVCSVTDTPPTLLVCLNRNSGSHLIYSGNRTIGINVMASQHEALSQHFARSSVPVDERFAQGVWMTAQTGAPLLSDALVALDCEIDQILEVGTHSVFFCGVKAAHFGPQNPALMYLNRAFHNLG